MLNAKLQRTELSARLSDWRNRLREFFLPSQRSQVYAQRTPPLTLFELRALTAFRLTLLASVVLLVLFALKSWLLPARNFALGQPVTASSKAWNTVPSAAVDGNRYGQLGFHSDNQDPAWLAVDLGSQVRLSELKIFGRAECCYEQSLPLALDVSSDGENYQQIAERRKPFGQYTPWTFRPKVETTARFVRLRTLRKTVLVVSEVEVYGRAL